jgi:hypothetical protein
MAGRSTPVHRRRDKAVQSGDVIANGRGPLAAQEDAYSDLQRAQRLHGADVVSKVLCLHSRAVMRFAAFAQGREHASDCEVAGAAALPAGQHGGGHGSGIPVPAAGLCDGEIDDLCNAIVENPSILQEFAEWRAWVRRCG